MAILRSFSKKRRYFYISHFTLSIRIERDTHTPPCCRVWMFMLIGTSSSHFKTNFITKRRYSFNYHKLFISSQIWHLLLNKPNEVAEDAIVKIGFTQLMILIWLHHLLKMSFFREFILGSGAWVMNSNQTAVHMNQISKMNTHINGYNVCMPAVKNHISHFNITFLLIMPSRFQFSVSYADKCFTNKPLLNTICRHKSYIIFCISNLLDMTVVL